MMMEEVSETRGTIMGIQHRAGHRHLVRTGEAFKIYPRVVKIKTSGINKLLEDSLTLNQTGRHMTITDHQ